MSTEAEIEKIEEEIKKTPYHKGTQAHIGRLKARLAKLREAKEKSSGKSYGPGFSVKKTGDATVLLVGFPSVGKSTLINAITNAESKTGAYDFTTLDVIPGMLEYRGAKIQILDIPGMISGAASGKGRGRQVLSVVRNADLIVIILDDMKQLEPIRKELYAAGFRLDEHPPDMRIVKKETGGVFVNFGMKKPKLEKAAVISVIGEFKIHNAEVLIRENVNMDQLIDFLAGNRIYIPSVTVFNKVDRMDEASVRSIGKNIIKISASWGQNLEAFREAIWDKLKLARIYMKRIGKDPDMKEPMIMKKGCTIAVIGEKILKSHYRYFKFARIWGSSARFEGQKVGAEHVLVDGDIVELHA